MSLEARPPGDQQRAVRVAGRLPPLGDRLRAGDAAEVRVDDRREPVAVVGAGQAGLGPARPRRRRIRRRQSGAGRASCGATATHSPSPGSSRKRCRPTLAPGPKPRLPPRATTSTRRRPIARAAVRVVVDDGDAHVDARRRPEGGDRRRQPLGLVPVDEDHPHGRAAWLAPRVDTGASVATGGRHWFDEARFGMFVHWGHCSQLGVELSWPLVGGVSVGGMSSTAIAVDDVPRRCRHVLPRRRARPASGSRLAADGRRPLRGAHHPPPRRLRPVADGARPTGRSPARRTAATSSASSSTPAGPRACASASTSRSRTGTTPTTRPSPRPTSPTAFIGYRRPDPEAWDRYLDVLLRPGARAAHRLRRRSTCCGSTAVGADARRVAGRRAARADPRAAARLPRQRPAAGRRRLRRRPSSSCPPTPPGGRWETCMTMNGSWGYSPDDDYKSARDARPHALRGGRPGRQPAAQRRPRRRRRRCRPSRSSGSQAIAGVDGPPRRGDPRHRARPRAVAVVRPVDPAGRPDAT